MTKKMIVNVKLPVEHKMFCGCKAKGEESCPVCLHQPGAFKILNKEVIEAAIALTLSVGAALNQYTLFDRAKGSNRTIQNSHPIGGEGKLVLSENAEVIVTAVCLMEGLHGIAEADIYLKKPEEIAVQELQDKLESLFSVLSIKEWNIKEADDCVEKTEEVSVSVPDPLLPPVIISQWWTNRIAEKYPDLIHIEEPDMEEDDIF